jgi:hypothetical protein
MRSAAASALTGSVRVVRRVPFRVPLFIGTL